jgi:hypothetical protein
LPSNTKTRPGRVHKDLTREAGIGPISLLSVVAGTLVAYGAFSLAAALAGGLLSRTDVKTDFRTNDWTGSGGVAAVAAAAVLLIAYLFGGYVAGRMARRRGLVHGFLVALVSLVVGVVAGAIVRGLTDDAAVRRNLRSIGVPTSSDQITGVGIAAAVLSLAAIVIGAVVGGMLGERWHAKLARRAADPSVGPAAEMQTRADHEHAERARRIERDPVSYDEVERTATPVAAGDPRPPAPPTPPASSDWGTPS